ncbi:MAG TPA: glycosyltransferase family 4 protein [Negativicutes bacterium]|nr:glycosyltransferase family 4 protein [Negativicutes bacterium]
MANRKIKICYISSVDVTMKFILFNQLIFLKREGFDVYVLCSPGKWLKDIEREGIKVKTIRVKRNISPFSDVITLIELFFYFRKEKFDIVHAHTPKAGLIGQLAAKLAGVPIIVNTIHGLYFQEKDSFKKRALFILTEKIAAKCSDLIFFVNKEDMQTVVDEKICSPDVVRYFGGGVDMARFNPGRFSQELIVEKKKQLGVNLNHNVIGIVARLVKEKGYEDLFEAFKEILTRFPQTTLLVAGFLEPEKKDAIQPDIVKQYGIENNVIFLGERTDVDEIYATMDMFVLPSYREGLGISLLEASAMEKPVVASDIRGCREAVGDGVTGKIVPLGDVPRLSQALMYLMLHPKEAKEMGENGRIRVAREFDERLIFGRIKEEYKRLLHNKGIV